MSDSVDQAGDGRGCRLELRTFDVDGTPAPLTDGPATIGQPVQVWAVNPTTPILSVAFNFDMRAVVATFLASEESGGPVPYDPAGLTINPLTFYPVEGGTLSITCTATTRYGPEYLSENLQVSSPTVTNLCSTTGAPRVWVDENQRTMLQFKALDDGPGIVINATVLGTQYLPGTLAFIQIARNARWLTQANVTKHLNVNGLPLVDIGGGGGYIYQGVTAALAPGDQGQAISVTDSPGQQLPIPPGDFQSFFIGNGNTEEYNTFLMFCANAMHSIWTPLGVLLWNWAGVTHAIGGGWSEVEDPENWPDPGGVATSEFPVWQGNTSEGQWIPGMDDMSHQDQHGLPQNTPVLQATYGLRMPIMPGTASWWNVGPPDEQGLPLVSSGFGQAPFQFYSFDPNNPALLKVQAPNGNYLNIRGGFGIGQLYCDCTSFDEADQFKLVSWQPEEGADASPPSGYYFLVSPDDTYAATINDVSNPIVMFVMDAQQPAEYTAMFIELSPM